MILSQPKVYNRTERSRGQISSIFDVRLKINFFCIFEEEGKKAQKAEDGRLKKGGIVRKAERGSGANLRSISEV